MLYIPKNATFLCGKTVQATIAIKTVYGITAIITVYIISPVFSVLKLFYSSSPKDIPIILASFTIPESGSTVFNFPAISSKGTETISVFFKASI